MIEDNGFSNNNKQTLNCIHSMFTIKYARIFIKGEKRTTQSFVAFSQLMSG